MQAVKRRLEGRMFAVRIQFVCWWCNGKMMAKKKCKNEGTINERGKVSVPIQPHRARDGPIGPTATPASWADTKDAVATGSQG